MVEIENKKEFKAIFLNKYGGDPIHNSLKFRDLEPDEVLIKMKTSTIHPADLAFTRGQYARYLPILPLIPGSEGSGVIVKLGSEIANNENNKNLIGKRVSLFANPNTSGQFYGLWAEYHYTKLVNCLVYNDDNIDFNKITFSLLNPLTALGFLDTVTNKHKIDAVVQNGSTSAFGKIFVKLCKKYNIKNISIVRKKENIQKIYDIGAYKVISTSEENWKNDLKDVLGETQATVCFECVGGSQTGQIISLMPKNSTIYHFGNLELKRLEEIDTSDFIFHKKVLKGWWLNEWLQEKTKEQYDFYKNLIKESIENDEDLFISNYSKTFPLENFEEAFMYYFTNMSLGKIILEMNKEN